MSVMTAITVGTALMSASNANKTRRQAKAQADQALKDRQEQQKKTDAEIAKYKEIKFTNPYEGMENLYEDLTVNQQQAQFQAQQGAQQRANILGGLRGAAGSSGIAGLAQSMANQGQLQAQQASASIGQQAALNQKLAFQEAESGRQATILGVQYGQGAGANTNYQQSMLNQENANISANQMTMNSMQSLSNIDFNDFGGNDFTPTPTPYNPLLIGPTNKK